MIADFSTNSRKTSDMLVKWLKLLFSEQNARILTLGN